MNSQDFLNEQEYIEPGEKRSIFFYPVIFSISAYIFFMLFEFISEGLMNSFSDLLLVLLIIGLPMLGLLFFLFGKKAGWVICSLFFMFLSVYSMAYFFKEINDESYQIKYQEIFLSIVSLLSGILLSAKSIRKQFKVSTGIYFIVVTMSCSFAAIIFYITNYR